MLNNYDANLGRNPQ